MGLLTSCYMRHEFVEFRKALGEERIALLVKFLQGGNLNPDIIGSFTEEEAVRIIARLADAPCETYELEQKREIIRHSIRVFESKNWKQSIPYIREKHGDALWLDRQLSSRHGDPDPLNYRAVASHYGDAISASDRVDRAAMKLAELRRFIMCANLHERSFSGNPVMSCAIVGYCPETIWSDNRWHKLQELLKGLAEKTMSKPVLRTIAFQPGEVFESQIKDWDLPDAADVVGSQDVAPKPSVVLPTLFYADFGELSNMIPCLLTIENLHFFRADPERPSQLIRGYFSLDFWQNHRPFLQSWLAELAAIAEAPKVFAARISFYGVRLRTDVWKEDFQPVFAEDTYRDWKTFTRGETIEI